jgi:hypothetical protein
MNLLVKIGIWGLLAGGTASALYADPVGGWLSPNGVSGGPSSTNLPDTASTPTGSPPSAGAVALPSMADLQVRVRQLHDQTRADARHVQHLQQMARKEKDIIKLNCVNDKLVQVKPQMNIADSAESELEATKDTDRMAIFDTVSQAAENVRRLREEADQCVGESIQSSDSSNTFAGPQGTDDPTRGFGTEIEAPAIASPID